MYSDASDEQLIQLHLSGDPRGMEAIYERYFDRVYRLAYSKLRSVQDAEDVTSAIFLKLCRSLDSFRGEAKFSTWIYTVASNAVMDSIRRRRPNVSLDADLRIDGGDSVPREIEDDAPGPEDRVADADFARYVYSKLDALPPGQRSVIELRYFMELSYQQIADQLGVELGTVKSRLNRAVTALRSLVSVEEEVKASASR
jgi:RNA polymerase sigma-70 factor (ECF subfamily)